jgi:type IV secretion system protein VirB10
MAQASTESYDTVRATQIAAPSRTIVQGTTLQATLETAISTELPGVIRAVVSDDVYSYDGETVLLPRGTRLIGSYNSDVSVVQDRVQLAWSRAVTPDGVSVELGGYGADTLGRSGQEGFVDGRFRQRFGSAALISLIGAAPEVVVTGNTSPAGQDVTQDIGNDLETTSQGVMGDYLSQPPVIYVDQGTGMTVFVNRDLVF